MLRVCKVLFLATFDLGEFSVRDWVLQSIHGAPSSPFDKPETTNNKKDSDNARKLQLREFLTRIPKMESHYCRADTSKQYLEPVWESKRSVFNEYQRMTAAENKEVVQWSTFQRVFHEMNLSLYAPKKDQCDMCSQYSVGSLLQSEYDAHQERKVIARNEKSKDKEQGKADPTFRCYTMDVQSVLLAPRLHVSTTDYKTKLKVHNYTIYNQVTEDVTCFLWNESEGGVSSDVFASTLYNFLLSEVNKHPNIKTIIIWSDGCTYQNRNVTMANALLNLALQKDITIIQKYLEKGHSQMEVDACHSLIEKKLGKKVISVPAQYVEICRDARVSPSPFQVKLLTFKDFSDFSSNLYYSSIRPGVRVGDPVLTDVRALLYGPNDRIQYKLDMTGEWCHLPKRPNRNKVAMPFSPKPLYSSRIDISLDKFKHLQELKFHLLEDYRYFYDNLPHSCQEEHGQCSHIVKDKL